MTTKIDLCHCKYTVSDILLFCWAHFCKAEMWKKRKQIQNYSNGR